MCRTLLLSGDFFLGGVVAATLAKLVLRLRALGGGSGHTTLNRVAAEAMLVGAAILRLGGSKAITHAIDDDSQDRIASALRVRQLPPNCATQDLGWEMHRSKASWPPSLKRPSCYLQRKPLLCFHGVRTKTVPGSDDAVL